MKFTVPGAMSAVDGEGQLDRGSGLYPGRTLRAWLVCSCCLLLLFAQDNLLVTKRGLGRYSTSRGHKHLKRAPLPVRCLGLAVPLVVPQAWD